MEVFLTSEGLISLLTLTLLEIVLGIDNVIFISIISGKLPIDQRKRAQTIGLIVALLLRVLLLLGISWVIGLKEDLINLFGIGFSGKDLILLGGGLFLLYSSTKEIYDKLEGEEVHDVKTGTKGRGVSLGSAIFQMSLLNIIFSFDSVLTAIGLVKEIPIMIVAVILSSLIMIVFAPAISDFVNKHPSLKILALSFLILIGTLLIAEAFHYEIPKGYAYFAMAFSLVVELINMRYKKNAKPVPLKKKM